MSALVFDTETTDVEAPEIVEAAYIEIDDGLSAGALAFRKARFKRG